MKHVEQFMVGLMVLAASIAVGQANNAPPQSRHKADPQKAQTAVVNRGQQIFDQNCSRCHNAPEGFSANISGTISKHMRVRAGLSNEDYEALLKFFNP
jgi:cytochrome c5